MPNHLLSPGKRLAFVLVAFAMFFMLLEGFSNCVLFVRGLIVDRGKGLNSRQHVMYDPLLGWVNWPNLRLTNYYGDGVNLSTNSQSHRGTKEYERAVPSGQRRLLCMGDSFTLAIGVGDDEAFCHTLRALDPHLETVNLGEPGYGFDQVYLKYKREGAKVDHQVVLISLIEDDFNRMQGPRFLAYEKPFVTAREGKLEVLNIPVPRISALQTWFRINQNIFDNLKTVDLGRPIANRLLGLVAPSHPSEHVSSEDVARLRLQETVMIARSRGAVPVFVYLKQDVRNNWKEETWRKFLAEEPDAQGVLFIDLMSEFRGLPPAQIQKLYHPRWRHYTAEANTLVARAILARLPRTS